MKITIIDDYAEREAARKAAKSRRNLRALARTLQAKAELEAQKNALLWRPSKENNYPPTGDELTLRDMFNVSCDFGTGPWRFVADDNRA